MKISKSILPNREPDAVIGGLSFWWKEKLQTNVWSSSVYEVDLVKWEYKQICDYSDKYSGGEYTHDWSKYSSFLTEIYIDKIKNIYADWLLEKELLGK